MAENKWFNNSNMFTGVNDDTHGDIPVENKSEVLATQGNVINSIKVFWNKLRRKLVHAITRNNTSEAVGGNYHPIFVNEDGGVQVCNPTTLTGSVTNNNINLDEIKPLYSGQIVCITVTNTTTNNTSFLTINNKNVYYPTGVQVKVSDVSNNTTYLFTFISGDGDKWILNNKINVASTNNSGLMTAAQCSKLEGIDDDANYYELTAATSTNLGGVKSITTGKTPNRDYDVEVNSNGTMKVNVPWTDTVTENWVASLIVGNANSITNTETTGDNDTYIKVVENGEVHGMVKIVGEKGTTVSSNTRGEIVIESPQPTSYNKLYNNGTIKNYSSSIGYLVYGPGQNNANTSYFLAGNGTWVKGILVPSPPSNIESEKTLKCKADGTVYWG